jgi:TetR/AcrR family transcriptional regulator, tetracycline repressor protein
VVEAALELLDEVGLEGLSVRGLARKLGVQVGALYWHVEGKQDLLEAITDRMMRELSLSGGLGGEWEDLVAELAHRLRGVLLSHRDGARVFVSSLGLGPNPAESAEVFLGTLREAGFSLELAAYAMNTVASFVTGFVLTEQSALIESEKFQGAPDEMIETIDPSRFPNLAEWVSMPHRSRDEVFAAQIRMIINGLRQELR